MSFLRLRVEELRNVPLRTRFQRIGDIQKQLKDTPLQDNGSFDTFQIPAEYIETYNLVASLPPYSPQFIELFRNASQDVIAESTSRPIEELKNLAYFWERDDNTKKTDVEYFSLCLINKFIERFNNESLIEILHEIYMFDFEILPENDPLTASHPRHQA